MDDASRNYIRTVRYIFQWALLIFIIFGGIEFYFFIEHYLSVNAPATPPVERPPLVEGFLPIGALMGLKLWLGTGTLDPVHPAAVIILTGALAASLLLKKGFCGYICPVGTLSDFTHKVGRRLFGRNIRVPKPLDYPLRSLKYILMAFFIYAVLIQMPLEALSAFQGSPYWMAADVKMLGFFTQMTRLTMYVLVGIFVLSLPVKNFWCRYLCPYGALLGLLSFLSPVKITRDETKCIGCGTCARNCPQYLTVDVKKKIRSPECTGCLTCVSVCPVQGGALQAGLSGGRKLHPAIHIASVAVVFFGIVLAAKFTDNWHSSLTHEDYRKVVPQASSLKHP